VRRTAEEGLRKSHVLVVDDEELYRRSLERILRRVGHTVSEARDATEALNAVSEQSFDLVLVDLRMPGLNGIELVRQIRDVNPDLPCIMVTGFGSPESSVDALRAGAFWYLEKPFDQSNLDVIRKLVDQAIELGRLRAENRILHSQLRSRYRFENIIGTSAALRGVLDMVGKVADTDSTVLVTGESGTGKELIAKAIHFNSRRADQPLVTVNCGAIPEELLESELFGHEKGAFTGALRDREGRFEAADGGTIFLDEIGDMSPNLQVKLLRVIQDRSFERVGSSRTRRVDARVIAATNQNLEKAIREGRFREDLYFRLNVIPIEVPPLRERREDIPQLAQHFLDVLNQERQTKVDSIAPGAMAILCDYDWPGNVRQLEHLIERLVVLRGEGEIREQDVPPLAPTPPSHSRGWMHLTSEGLDFNEAVHAYEKNLIRQALALCGGNKAKAAELLRLHRTTLVEKIKKLGLEAPH
jgi:DNA-binding NtrC family response regulator